MRKIIVLIWIVSFCVTCRAAFAEYYSSDYFPLHIGGKSIDIVGEEDEVSVITASHVSGNYTIYSIAHEDGSVSYYSNDNTYGILYHGANDGSGDIYFNSPIAILPPQFEIGQIYNSPQTYITQEMEVAPGLFLPFYMYIDFSTSVVGIEDIIGPAGICIRNTIKLTQTLAMTFYLDMTSIGGGMMYLGEGEVVADSWILKSVGIVKETVVSTGASAIDPDLELLLEEMLAEIAVSSDSINKLTYTVYNSGNIESRYDPIVFGDDRIETYIDESYYIYDARNMGRLSRTDYPTGDWQTFIYYDDTKSVSDMQTYHLSGNIMRTYKFYDEEWNSSTKCEDLMSGGITSGRIYDYTNESGGTKTGNKQFYAYITGTPKPLIEYSAFLSDAYGAGLLYYFYDKDSGDKISSLIEFDGGETAEINFIEDGAMLTKAQYTSGDTCWFLWGDDVYNGYDNVVVEKNSISHSELNNITMYSPFNKVVMDPNGEYVIGLNVYNSELKKINITDDSYTIFDLGPHEHIADLALDSSGEYAYIAHQTGVYGDFALSKMNVSNGDIISSAPVGEMDYANGLYEIPHNVILTPDEEYACVISYYDNTVTKVNLNDFTTQTIAIGNHPRFITVDPLGRYVYVINSMDNITKIDVATDVTTTIDTGGGEYYITFEPSGTYAYVVNNWWAAISKLNISDDTFQNIAAGNSPLYMAIDSTGKYAYVTNFGGITKVDLNNSTKQTISTGEDAFFITIDPAGKYAYVTNWDSDNITIIDLSSNEISAFETNRASQHIAVDPSGRYAYVANMESYNGSWQLTKIINTTETRWNAYTVTPNTENPEAVLDPANWNLIGAVSDLNNLTLPELGDWWQYCADNGIIPEFPPLSTDGYLYDGLHRLTRKIDHNPYMDTTHTYAWDFEEAGHVKWEISYDYEKDGDIDPIVSKIYNNGSDYDLTNMNNWQLLSETNHLNDESALYTYWPSGNRRTSILYGQGSAWRCTTEYWDVPGAIAHYQWLADESTSAPGDVIEYHYDDKEREIRRFFDTHDIILTYYQTDNPDSKKSADMFLDPNWNWQRTVAYWPDGAIKQYQFFVDGHPNQAGDLREIHYDDKGREIRHLFDGSDNNIATITLFYYQTDAQDLLKSAIMHLDVVGSEWVWKETISYWEDGATWKYRWVTDPHPNQGSDATEFHYDDIGRVTTTLLDGDDNSTHTIVLTYYWTESVDSLKKTEILLDSGWNWQGTTEYWEDGATMHYRWLKDPDDIPDGDDLIYIEYNMAGNQIAGTYDNGSPWTPPEGDGGEMGSYFDLQGSLSGLNNGAEGYFFVPEMAGELSAEEMPYQSM